MPTAMFIVSGKVQGVFYRASTGEQALRLGIAGHANNRSDGSVEVLVSGAAAALDALQCWLRTGPTGAVVESVSRNDLPAQALQGFQIG